MESKAKQLFELNDKTLLLYGFYLFCESYFRIIQEEQNQKH